MYTKLCIHIPVYRNNVILIVIYVPSCPGLPSRPLGPGDPVSPRRPGDPVSPRRPGSPFVLYKLSII